MDGTQILVSIITVLGVFVSSGIIQFFVTRKDKKREEEKVREKDMVYEVLRKEFKEASDAREKRITERYKRHEESIRSMAEQHEKDFQKLREAIEKLTENDTRITNSIEHIAEKQEIMADSLMGQAHDRIMALTDRITERGCITNREKATIKSMYKPYRNLGGNGEVKESVDYILTLTTVTEEDARVRELELRDKEYREMRKNYEEDRSVG